MKWHPGKIYYFELISLPFEFEKIYIWDDFKNITCTGWKNYSETCIDAYDHFDRITKNGVALYQSPLSEGLGAEYWRET